VDVSLTTVLNTGKPKVEIQKSKEDERVSNLLTSALILLTFTLTLFP
jgi:hypothetical protein